MNSRFGILAGLGIVIFLGACLIILAAIVGISSATIRNNSQPGEPKYAYMDRMYDKGVHQDQLLCNDSRDCVVLTTLGAHSYVIPSIKLDGVTFTNKQDRVYEYAPVSQGIYCLGSVSYDQCMRISTLKHDSTCPERLEYLGVDTYLFSESCLKIK